MNDRCCYRWRAADQYGQCIDFRLTALRDAKATRAFLLQARETLHLYQTLTVITDKAPTYVHVISEINDPLGPEDAIRHITRKHLNNRIESDYAARKRMLRPMRRFRDLASAKGTLNGIKTFRAIRKAEFEDATKGAANEISSISPHETTNQGISRPKAASTTFPVTGSDSTSSARRWPEEAALSGVGSSLPERLLDSEVWALMRLMSSR